MHIWDGFKGELGKVMRKTVASSLEKGAFVEENEAVTDGDEAQTRPSRLSS